MAKDETLADIFIGVRGSLARLVSSIAPPKEIEDIVQETYVRVCQAARRGPIDQPRSFMMRTARNLALDYVKRAESRLAVSMDEEFDLSPELGHGTDRTYEIVASNEEFAHFCEAVRQLPVQCRRAFVLKKVYGYSQREIARQLNISESTVEKHIATGIKRCTLFMLQQRNSGSPDAGPRTVSGAGRGGRP
ncbi:MULTISPECIES: sigma-70 family RNA polymerase sigma factor [unclassified Microbulbifer]|uniref:sigma-70 family RNA polymerase sigma factor n=1 Tax=unclassified Microbulbifer TaxID=2619833 RepID=UPI0027E5B0D1|nr:MULTISPECIES: sigma-70 family RNA polymerase sigma factor [unclassified Microbulbifer]